MVIRKATKHDYPRLVEIWERAVRTTHDFLAPGDFVYYRSHLTYYFERVNLYAYQDDDANLLGFMGVSGNMLEMLFVDDRYRGMGIGKSMIRFALTQLHVRQVDVNEQNTQALGFYLRMGFHIIGRSPLDGEGRPYPLLHLQYLEKEETKTRHMLSTCKDTISIRKEYNDKKQYLSLLLLADEQETMIDRYIDRGEMFVLEEGGTAVAECVVTDEGDGICELKNIAVHPNFQRQGYGYRLIEFVKMYYANQYHTMLVGTGDTPATVLFYRHCGFVYSHRVSDFFTQNYDHPIVDNGVLLKDMLYFKYAMKPDFTIRHALVSDAESIQNIFQTTVLTVNRQDYTQSEVEDWASCGESIARWEHMVRVHYFIVAIDTLVRVVGFASVTPQGYLHSMFVHKDFQRKGIATLLLRDIECYAVSAGIRRLNAEVSLTARPFFERYGWIVEQAQVRKANRLFLSNFLMTKDMVLS